MEQYDPAHPQQFYIDVFSYFLDFLDENEVFVRKILSSSARASLIGLMSVQIEHDLKLHFKDALSAGVDFHSDPDLLAALYTSAMIYCAEWWITQPNRMSKEQVIQQFSELLARIF